MKRHRKFSFLLGEGSQHRGHSLGVNSVAHSSDGRVVTAGRDATVRVWENGCVVAVHSDHADAVHDVAFVPASGAIVSCSSDNTIRVHNGKVVDERVTHCDAVRKVKMVSSTTLVSASLDGTVCMHDLRSSASTPTVVNMDDPLFALAVGANEGKYMIVAGSARGNIYMFDPRAGLPSADEALPPIIRSAHKACIRDLTFCDGGTKIVSCGADSCVRLWDTRSMRSPLTYVLHTDAVFTLATVPNMSSIILSGSRDGTVAATNIRTFHTSRIISAAHPVTHVSVSPRNVVYMCTTRSTVDAFVLTNVMHNDLAMQQQRASIGMSPETTFAGNEVITPSKVSIDLDTSQDHIAVSHPPAVGPLGLVDPIGRRYESPFLRAIKFASPEEESRWCTSSEMQRPQGLATSEPDISLPGSTHALVHCTLLNDKRHVLSLDDANEIVLWNICDQQIVHKFPQNTTMKDALEHSQVETHCSSWCTVECRWGALCVTLSFESSLDTFVNKWWMRYVRPPMSADKRKAPQSVETCRSDLSIYRIPRKDRADLLQQPLLNLCEIALGNLFDGARDHSVVVWFVPGGTAPQGTGKRFVLSELENDEAIVKVVPSWVASVHWNPKQLIVASLTSAHTVELLPYPGGSLPALKQAQNNIPKRKALAELAVELVSVLKLKMPKTRDLLDQLTRSPSSVPQRSNNNKNSACALGFPFGNEDPQEVALTALQPDEFVEFLPAGDDGQPNSAIVIDPMMLIGTIFFLHKEKGSGVLRLWYRKNSLLSS